MIKRKLAEVENEVKRKDEEIKSLENKINTFLKIEDAKQFEHEDDSVKKPFDEDHAKCELNGSEPIWNDSLNPKSRPQQQENLVSLNVPEVTSTELEITISNLTNVNFVEKERELSRMSNSTL